MSVFFPVEFNFGLRIGLLTAYFIACIVLLCQFSRDKEKEKNIPERQLIISYRWLKFLLATVFFLVANFIFITFNFIKYDANHVAKHLTMSFLLAGISFTLLVFGMLFFPEVLYGLPKRITDEDVSTLQLKDEIGKITENITEEAELSIEEDPFNELAEQIKIYLEKEKPFLDPNFAVSQIALDLKVPQNHVSYCINSIFKTKFTKLKTELRVEHAKTLLNNSQYSNLTIEGIAQMSGFGTRSNFYNAFKNETGLTPSEYLRDSTADI
jgi:AraC-like DNA-binding protein